MNGSGWKSAVAALVLGAFVAGSAQAQDFKTMVVQSVQVGGTATVGGTVIPFKEATFTAQIPGRVEFIAGSEGDSVKKGDVVVAIDDDDIQAQRRAAQAQIYNAETALRNAQVQYSRELISPRTNSMTGMPGMGMPNMFDQMFTRPMGEMMGRTYPGLERHADLYAQGAGVNQARNSITTARANLESLDAKLKDARQTAPFDGVIVEKLAEVGDTVQPGTPLIEFAHTDFLRIIADVPVRLVNGLSKGMFVPARLDIGGAKIQAKVAQIFPMADRQRHTVKVKFDLPKGVPGGPGMYVEVTIPDSSVPLRAVPSIPENALVWRGSLPSVFVLKDGQPSLRVVRVGYPLGNGNVSVLSGLSGGEQVIVDPPANLVSGGR
ncbi:efflux RND transporter periplasmic adaptor subunit [Magnetospira sp. QH-2]|uniref:efflux RND transporter periplasmic adaptor subunit n=1 Tax=Magnetospira sp. (strain QH-2) TaxID=1288970 RepID=UPI0003E81408|nr:efflux RND transporter periplasmic adaptor subunit [Magnetospira sp. QH-2]CCQ75185.1 putative efflux transporter, RND family, MFP subunit [Magnetospira sp. QH-2]